MNLRFNLSRFAWVAAVLFFLVVVMPQSTLAQRNYGFYGSFHVGSTYPLEDLNDTADSNIHFRYDLSFRYKLSDRLEVAAVGFYGFNQFTEDHFTGTDNMYWRNLSANIKVIMSVTPNYRLYWQAGPGSYTPKAGSNSSGYNVGGGFQVNMSGASRLEFGIDYHVINTFYVIHAGGHYEEIADLKTKFLTLQLGVIFPLF